MNIKTFKPTRPNSTLNIDVSAASQSVTIFGKTGTVNTVRVMNNGTATVWVEIQPEATTAVATTSVPVGPGTHEVIEIGTLDGLASIFCSVIAAGATGRVYFTPGEGS